MTERNLVLSCPGCATAAEHGHGNSHLCGRRAEGAAGGINSFAAGAERPAPPRRPASILHPKAEPAAELISV